MKALIFDSKGHTRVLADSALGRNRQPWFLPDFGENWRGHFAIALRISRLGKGVRPEFAARYVEERTIAWLPEADLNPAPDYMDGAAVIGEWVPVGVLTDLERSLIADAARFSTLKQGDVILLDYSEEVNPIKINDKIHAEIDGMTVIDFNIK